MARSNPLGGQRVTPDNINRIVRALDARYRYSSQIFYGEAVLSVYDGPGGVFAVTGRRDPKMRTHFASNSSTLTKVEPTPDGVSLTVILYPASVAFARMVGAAMAAGNDPETVEDLFGKTVAARWLRGVQKEILDAVVDDFAFHPMDGADGPKIEPFLFGEKNPLPESIKDALDHLYGSELKSVQDAMRRAAGDWLASEDFAAKLRRRMKAPDAFSGYRENPRRARNLTGRGRR